MATYEIAMAHSAAPDAATGLYEWNARISAAFLFPKQICEITTRNAASEALTMVFGPKWPWSAGFERSLPSSGRTYDMRKELMSARSNIREGETGKVIAALRFKFWVDLFTARFDGRLWARHLRTIFPNLPGEFEPAQARRSIHLDSDHIRKLRNRIAHHEPVFYRNLHDDHARLRKLIAWRCNITARWIDSHEAVSTILSRRP
jgi:hypothetical protein